MGGIDPTISEEELGKEQLFSDGPNSSQLVLHVFYMFFLFHFSKLVFDGEK